LISLKKLFLSTTALMLVACTLSAVLHGEAKTADSSCVKCHTDKSMLTGITEKLPHADDADCGTSDPGEG